MRDNVGIEVKRDPYDIAEDIGTRRNEKVEKGIDYSHDIRARIYANEQEPLYAFNKAFSDSIIMMTPASGSGSLEQFAELLNHTWEAEESGTELEALVSNQQEHLPVLNQAVEALEQNNYTGKIEIEGIYTEDTIEEAINTLEGEGATVRVPVINGPQGEHSISEGQRTNLIYKPAEKSLEPQITPDGNDPETVENIENSLKDVLDQHDLLS